MNNNSIGNSRYAFSHTICEFLRLSFIFTIFVNFVLSAIYKVLSLNTETLHAFMCVLYLIFFVLYLIIRKKINVPSVFITLFSLIVVLLTFVLKREYLQKNFDETFTFLCISLPCIIMFSDSINENTYRVLGFLSIVSGLFFVIIFFVQSFVSPILNSFDYQTVSYALIVPIFYLLQKKKNLFTIILLVVMMFFAVFMGGRGPLICVVLYLMYLFLKLKKIPLLLKVTVAAGVIAAVFNYKHIVNFIIEKTEELQMGGSFAVYSEYGDAFSDSGRIELFRYCIDKSSDNWAFGTGLFSDRFISNQIDRSYPHNVFLEFVLQFGYPISFLFFSFFLLNSFNYLVLEDDKEKKRFFDILFFSTGFMILLFSSSYLLQPAFFALIGLFINKKRVAKTKEKELIFLKA